MQHARVAVYTITSGTFKELAKDAEEGMLPIFERHPGFLHYGLQEAGHHVVSISIWETVLAAITHLLLGHRVIRFDPGGSVIEPADPFGGGLWQPQLSAHRFLSYSL